MDLLIIDDDRELCALLAEFLLAEGFGVESVHTGPLGLERIRQKTVDLVILDIMLPGMDGLSLLRTLRWESDVPVIMLTARGKAADRILGLELGADDYLRKPFSSRELLARIRAVSRRVELREQKFARIETERIVLNPSTREVDCDGQPLELTAVEFDILEMLMRAADRVVTRDQIMDKMHGRSASSLDRSIDMHISHLRRKMGPAANTIKTVRGLGYRFLLSPPASGVKV